MTTKEKLLKRLKSAFGIDYPVTVNWSNRMGAWDSPGISWQLGKVKCYESGSVALFWKRWVLADEQELIEYGPTMEDTYKSNGWRIEEVNSEDNRHCSYCKNYRALVDGRMFCVFLKKRITARKKACKAFDLN